LAIRPAHGAWYKQGIEISTENYTPRLTSEHLTRGRRQDHYVIGRRCAPSERTGILMEETKFLAVTKQEAELLMDSFKVSNPITRNIALKAAGLVLEFASEEDVRDAQRVVDSSKKLDIEALP
jgi:hypothetical protein